MAVSTINMELAVNKVMTNSYITDPNSPISIFHVVNGWAGTVINVPDTAKNKFSLLITSWIWKEDIGDASKEMVQVLTTQSGYTYSRRHADNGAWSDWMRNGTAE